jgi:murein DD-endopeptidase MepM/ murein hydrolase activator NlpD
VARGPAPLPVQKPVGRTLTGTVAPPPQTSPPPPLDPRLERPQEDPQAPGWTILVVPRGASGQVREYTLTAGQLASLRIGVIATVGVILVLVIALGVNVPRSAAYDGLLAENLALKQHLQVIDDRMAEVDRLLLRMRLYDAQLKSLAEPKGDHGGPDSLDGPEDPERFANSAFLDALDDADPEGIARLEAGLPMTRLIAEPDLRPAEAWATSVLRRADTFLELFELAEPDLNRMVEDLEDLRALELSLPSRWPAHGLLSSGYGWRKNPFSRRSWKFHSGLDLANQPGTIIKAAGPGTVIAAEYHRGYGRMALVDHGFGITTLYAHMRRVYVTAGDVLQAGDEIGQMGSTGQSTGPHLHFEVRLDGNPVDPLDYLPERPEDVLLLPDGG